MKYFLIILLAIYSFSIQAADISIQLDSDTIIYENGRYINYTVTVSNLTGSRIDDIEVNADFMTVMSGTENAFRSTLIDGSASLLSSAGSFDSNGDLAVTGASLLRNGTLTYTIQAQVTDTAVDDIEVQVSATTPTETVTSDIVKVTPAPYEYSLTLLVDQREYPITGQLEYTLVAENTGSYAVQHLNISQVFSTLTVETMDGVAIVPFTEVTNSAVKEGSTSDVGSFNSSGDLQVTDARIEVGGKLIYTMQATLANKLTGDIMVSASSTTKDGLIESNSLTTPPAKGILEVVRHEFTNTAPYLVNEERQIHLTVENTGEGIVHGYRVQHNIKDILTTLANDLVDSSSTFNHSDVTAHPYQSWSITVANIGDNSVSQLGTGEVVSDYLDDVVSVYPGESIDYLITAKLSPVAIGTIKNLTARVLNDEGSLASASNTISTIIDPERVLHVGDSEIQISKTTSAGKYSPGQDIVYDLTVENLSNKYFANNLIINDKLSCVQTEQAAGIGQGPAFKQWKLEVVKGTDNLGTDAGSFSNYGETKTGDLTISPDIAPGGKVQYKLTATVSDTAVGLILDDASCDDDVSESGTGIEMPANSLSVTKDVDFYKYSPGQQLTYTIKVANTSDATANLVPVVDDLASIMVTDTFGNSVPAYSSWEVTSDYGPLVSGIDGTITSPDILDVKATIPANTVVTYTVVARVNPTANSKISNIVTVDGKAIADRGSVPREFNVELSKTAKVDGIASSYYSKPNSVITYQIVAQNSASNGYATNVDVKDAISTIQANMLEPDNTPMPVFSSWTIGATKTIIDPSGLTAAEQNALLNATSVGSFSDNTDLDTTAQIAPNVRITYTIEAQIDRNDSSKIVWGSFTNSATVSTPDNGDSNTSSVTIYPRDPDVLVTKTTPNNNFAVGETVTFDIYVFNKGSGYANDIDVSDDINGLGVFEPGWTIVSNTDSHARSGSYPDAKSAWPDGGNIATKIDIDPKESAGDFGGMGYVKYSVTGVVKSDYMQEQISNTAEIHDPATNTDHSSTAEISKDSSEDKFNVSILKTSDKVRVVPGEDITYTITLFNNSTTVEAENLTVVDLMTEIKSVLANDNNNAGVNDGKTDNVTNYTDQSPFEYWSFKLPDESSFGPVNNDNFIYPDPSSSDVLNLAPQEAKQFQIKARVKDNFIGSDISGSFTRLLANDAYVFRHYGDVDDQKSHVSHQENEIMPSGARTVRQLLVNGVANSYYSPGDKLTYTVKVYSTTGYLNNHQVQENIEDVTVLLMDGTSANPFSTATSGARFSVDVMKDDSNGGNGTTTGEADGTIADDTNINTIIDVAGGDYVLYTVEGIVRDDSVGNITIGGITVQPNDYHLAFYKTTDETTYQPGNTVTYHLHVTNDGLGHAYNIPIVDELSTVTVDLVDGSEGKAFTQWTIEPSVTLDPTLPDSNAQVGSYADNEDLNTLASIPMGATIDYVVTATINSNAVGEITNILSVNGDRVSASLTPDADKFNYNKKVTAYYDTDGTTELDSGLAGYKPDGYVEYEIVIGNENEAHLNDITIFDDIKGITTTCYNLNTGVTYNCAAFDRWTVTSSVDSSGISHPGNVANNANIDTTFDLAAKSYGSFIKYTIKAHIVENAVGEFKNLVLVSGRYQASSDRSIMLPVALNKTHKAYTDTSKTTVKTTYNHQVAGQKVVYHLRIENSGNGLEYGKALIEKFSELQVRLAQATESAGDSDKAPAYEPKGWIVSATTDGSPTTSIGDFAGGSNVDIDIPYVSIAPQGWIDFMIESEIRDDAIDVIEITPTYGGSHLSQAKITPEAQGLAVTKEIVSLGDKPYSSGDKYKPGDSVEYQLVVENTENVWRDNSVIRDLISEIKVEVIGGATESALINTNISHIVSTGLDSDVDTKALSYEADSDLNIAASDGLDIAPREIVTFTITGDIRQDAVGTIDANSATGGETTVATEMIPPVEAELEFSKSVTHTTADSSDNTEYNPGGQVIYQVTVKNIGEGTANDIEIKDLISSINTSEGGKAFSNSSVHILEQPDSSRFSIAGSYEGTTNLDATFDLMPGDSVTFEITATVANDAMGTISNIATVNGENSNEVVLEAGYAEILAAKRVVDSVYVPGQSITYYIDILNDSDTSKNVSIVDPISTFVVTTADGSEKTALTSWTIKSELITDGNPGYTDISNIVGLPDSTDLNTTIRMAAKHPTDGTETHVRMTITGIVRQDAIGQFTNTATIDGKNYRVDSGFITPAEGSVEVTKVASKTPIAVYIPGETIGFDVEVRNSGTGYLSNLNIADLTKNIRTDFAGQEREGQVFEQWAVTNVTIVGSDTSLTQLVAGSEVTGANGYSANYNIAPSQSVMLHLEGVVNDKAMGDITNTVTVTETNGNVSSAQATYTPDKANLTLSKTVDKALYEAGDTLTYTIEITNTTGAWANNVQVTDLVTTIESSTIDGHVISAFDPKSISISAVSVTGETSIPVVPSGDINGTIEIAPNDTLTITVQGRLNSLIHGQVKNIVSVEFDGTTLNAEAVSEPVIPEVKLTKVAPVENYVPGEVSDFVISIENKTNGYAEDIELEDLISGLTVETIDGNTEQAFSYWVLDIESNDANTVINSKASLNEDIQFSIDLAPLDTVVFTVHGTVNQKAVGDISNTASMLFNGDTKTATAILIPYTQDVSFIKTLADGSQQGEYTADEDTEFHITLTNNAQSFAQNIKVRDMISDLSVINVIGSPVPALTAWDISYQITGDTYSTTTIDSLPIGENLDVVVTLAPSATIDFIVKGKVNPLALGEIKNTATMDNGSSTLDSTVTLKPSGVVLVVDKVADKTSYSNDDEQIIYTLAATNRGSIDASNVHFSDEISKLQGANGNPLFTEWTTTIVEYDTTTLTSTVLDTQDSVDLDYAHTLKAYEGNIVRVTIVGRIGKGLDDDITNTFTATPTFGNTEQDSVTVHVKKFSDNEGELVVTKKSLQSVAQVGDVIEYEVIIENPNEAEFKNVQLMDKYPSGFQYIEGSAEVTNSGPDGQFNTADDVITTGEPTIASGMSFRVGDMLAYGGSGSTVQEKIRVRYLMRVTVGATFGDYINTAYAMTPAPGMSSGALQVKSNMSSASVEVTPDKLFDTASIIGKVFEDFNGDGYQADATAHGIKLSVDVAPPLLIADSVTLKVGGQEKGSANFKLPSVEIDRLSGVSRNRPLPESNIAIVQFATRTAEPLSFTVTTDNGTAISANQDGSFTVNHTGAKAKGLSAENILVTRNLYKDGDRYLREIIIENTGLYEEGIPGIKLMTVEGIVIETDQYGRYHVPDQWVENKKGKQFLVKLDTDSLPTGMKVISENPQVKRITPNALSKFNFSIQSEDNE